jgi:hypothetical protein
MNNTALIAQLEAILQAGVATVTIDGTTTTYDLESVRRQLADLRRTDTTQNTRKPKCASLNTSGLFGG